MESFPQGDAWAAELTPLLQGSPAGPAGLAAREGIRCWSSAQAGMTAAMGTHRRRAAKDRWREQAEEPGREEGLGRGRKQEGGEHWSPPRGPWGWIPMDRSYLQGQSCCPMLAVADRGRHLWPGPRGSRLSDLMAGKENKEAMRSHSHS